MSPIERATPRARIFLDTGVIIQGCFTPWGASKAVLILATLRDRFTVVLAEAIEREIHRVIAKRSTALGPTRGWEANHSVAAWLDRVRVERRPLPSAGEIREQLPSVLPALRHVNDLEAVVTAIQARPDWVISDNREHWNETLAWRTGLRIVTPLRFLQQLRLREA
jgi:hypothetical protein